MRALLTYNLKLHLALHFSRTYKNAKTISTKPPEKKEIAECCHLLNIPVDSKQDVVRQAFLDLAKKYHPDSGSAEADMDKFINIEHAFRTLSKYNTGETKTGEVEKIDFDIRHTAPQHRQYLSFDGYGHGTIFQRQKQYAQVRAQRAAENVLEHRKDKAIASDKTLLKKGSQYDNKHDIKTKYGFDRLVEDLIQESISKGEFDNLSGKGKPLKNQNNNPYVDFTTHKLNEVLINNGYTPEWITLDKEIDKEIANLKEEIQIDRMPLGPFPLNEADQRKWEKICDSNSELASSINMKINKYNLIVPLLHKQKFHVNFHKISDDILKNGIHSIEENKKDVKTKDYVVSNDNDNLLVVLFKALFEVISYTAERKVVMVNNNSEGFIGKIFKTLCGERKSIWK